MNRVVAAGRRHAGAHAIALLALALLPARAAAGPVFVVKSGALAPYEATIAGFRAAHRGEVIEATLDGSEPEALGRRITAARPDVVVAVGLKAALFARERLPRTPIVFCVVQNPERYELGGPWITGVSTDVPASAELEALRLAVPDVKSVGLLYGRTTGESIAREARQAAAQAKLKLVERPIGTQADLPREARDLVTRVDALWMPADPTLATPEAFRFLLELTLSQRKPLLVFSEALVRAGALVAVSPDYGWVGARVADAVARIRMGDRAGDVPVTPLKRTRVVGNPTTARTLGRSLPAGAAGDVEVIR